MRESIIHLENVTAGYSREHPVLRNVNLSVEENGFVAIIGPNGGGKTTLLRVILGLMKPYSGTVEVKVERSKLGYVPQVIPNHSFPVTVLDVVLMGRLGRKGMFRRMTNDHRRTAMEKLHLLGVDSLAGKRLDELSGGQKQRVLIARALAGEPAMLLLDEPVASVDHETQSSFYDNLSQLNQNMTILLVTHDVGAVSSYVKSIACINTTLVSHGESLEEKDVEKAYGCPFELVTHGVPHRVLGRGEKKHG